WKITRAQPGLRCLSKELLMKPLQGSFQVGESYAFVDKQAFHLVKHRGMRWIKRVSPVHAARTNDTDRRSHLFHRANLHGGCVRAKELIVANIESIARVARRVACWNVQGIEVIEGAFDLRTIFDCIAHRNENVFD